MSNKISSLFYTKILGMKQKNSQLQTKLKSNSKSKSKDKQKTLQKVLTSPPKYKKQVYQDHGSASKKKAQSRSSEKGRQKRSSSSKSGHKNTKLKAFESVKKIGHSPYQGSKQKPKKGIKSIQANSNISIEIDKCKKAIQNQNIEQAMKYISKLLKRNEFNIDLIYLMGYTNELQNNAEEAKRYYRNLIKLCNEKGVKKPQQQSLERLQQLAKATYYLNLFESTIENCNKILEQDKKWDIYELKGKAQLARKKYGPAIDSFSNALAINRQKLELHQYQGDCYKGIQAYQLALNCYAKYNQVFSTQSLRILQKKAECFKMLGNKKKEEEMEEKIIRLRQQLASSMTFNLKTIKQKSLGNKIEEGPQQKYIGGGLLPLIRPSTSTLTQVQEEYSNGNLNLSYDLVQKIMQMEGPNLKNLYWSAVILLQMQDYVGCENNINSCIKILQNPSFTLITFLLPDSQQQNMISNLKIISNKLKQLNAYSLTEQQDKLIMQRRKKCLQEALNVFRNSQNSQSKIDGSLLNSKLTSILQESSMRSSRIYDNEQNSIFILKHIRKVIFNWCSHRFSLQSLQETTDLAYKLVKIRYKQFAILPMHIIYYTLRKQNWNKSFSQIDKQINTVLSRMSQKYPPSETEISSSQLKTFDIVWQKKPKINLFTSIYKQNPYKFNSFKQLHKAIEILSEKADQQFYRMNQICKHICIQQNNGFSYKVGLKVDKNYVGVVEERVLSRIVEKMLSKQIKQKRDSFFNDIMVNPSKKLSEYFKDIQTQWEQTIDEIIVQKNIQKQQIQCNVYDFLRGKCMFNSISEIRQVALDFIKLHSNGQIYLLQIQDRLTFKTKDVVLKFKIKDIVAQFQLALEFQSLQNQFNHGLYQLFRSPFGSFFASVMWFSGFALKKNEMFFRQKIKWGLPGLEHLLEFIYQDQLAITLINQQQKCSIQVTLTDFQISTTSITCNMCTKSHLYYSYNSSQNSITQQIEAPKQKFVISLTKNNFITETSQKYTVKLRVEGSQIFLNVHEPHNMDNKNKFHILMLTDSVFADVLTMKINQSASNSNKKIEVKEERGRSLRYAEQIEESRRMQKKLIEILNEYNK